MKVICLVGLLPFPGGGGATSRLRSFALGLAEAAVPVEVHAYAENHDAGTSSGEYGVLWRGIPTWTYSFPRVESNSGRWRLRRLRWREDAAILNRVEKSCAEGRVRAVFFYNQEPGFALSLLRVCRRWKVPFVQQYAELHIRADIGQGVPWPHFLREHGHMRLIPRLADGAVVISRFLQERCERTGRAPVLRVPALTNTETQPPLPLRPDTPFALTYLGAGARRDCLPTLIAGFRLFQSKFPQCRLQLLGMGRKKAEAVWQELKQAGLQEVVRVECWKPVAELKVAMAETDVFVLLRTDDDSSRACFPTRLPEYLLHERAVLMNPVGDVATLLSPEKEYARVHSLAAEEIAGALQALARDPGRRHALGIAGAAAAEREFGYRRWGCELARFFQRVEERCSA